MSTTVRVRPYSPELRAVQSQLNQLFEPFARLAFEEPAASASTWVPPVDISEEGDRLVVRAEVPGMKQDAIDLSFEDGTLTIRGERIFNNENANCQYHRVERPYGSFVRSFRMPRAVDAEKISAQYRDGILEISIPKREESKPRQIKINVAG